MELDIRGEQEEEVRTIRFGSADDDINLPDTIRTDDQGNVFIGNSNFINGSLLLVGDEIDDLIKALHKAKELGWY